jgi:regulator of sigma D
MDYVAAGHFALYERILEGRERRKGVARAAAELYPQIAETTQFFVDFNDRYDQLDDAQMDRELSSDLSKLGERLATRIELEDRLIAELVPES